MLKLIVRKSNYNLTKHFLVMIVISIIINKLTSNALVIVKMIHILENIVVNKKFVNLINLILILKIIVVF